LVEDLARFWLPFIVCGCFALFGNHLSTVSAQDKHPLLELPLVCAAVSASLARGQSNIAASYARYSSDLQDSSSIAQQQRKCREKAEQNGHVIKPELEFPDKEISGTKRDRTGLNAMLAAARSGLFSTLYLDSLSRLARECVISLPLLKELVYVCNVRIISVTESLDSANGNWELTAIFRSWMHQEYLKVLRDAVLRGQEEAILNDYSIGDWPFGYWSEPIPGSERTRRGRNPKPRMRVVIREDHAKWVRQIFFWFAQERRSLDWIARDLTRRNAPKDHRSSKPGWHHQYVKAVLRNVKYIGIWSWGKRTNVRNPLTGQVRQDERPIEEVAKWQRERPELRIIEDDLFFKAQALLDENERRWQASRTDSGRFRGPIRNVAQPRHLLQQLIKCRSCGSTFQISGVRGMYLVCAGYLRGACNCRTRLPRELAERKILQAIGARLVNNERWVQVVLDVTRVTWQELQRCGPAEAKQQQQELAVLDLKIERLVDSIEAGTADANVTKRLAKRRSERVEVQQRLETLRQQLCQPTQPPSQEWLIGKLQDLYEVLKEGGPAAAITLRSLVGSVVVTEVAVAGRKRKRWQGEFSLGARAVSHACGIGNTPESESATSEEIVVEFGDPPPWAAFADRVKELFDLGVGCEAIATQLGCPFPWVAKARAWWYSERGLVAPDGRQCRRRLAKPKLAGQLAEAAKELWDKGLYMQDIAEKLGCCRDLVTDAIRHWFSIRGLPVPDGRTRRKNLKRPA
jgi:DNA invertase Pin-like site-specific DNA recombinase